MRRSRLEACTEKLTFARETCRAGLAVSEETTTIRPIDFGALFDTTCPVSINHKALPPSAFLIPAVLDALRTSKWAPITTIVPGEADLFCARAALEPSRTILTNDSDLLLYNLGNSGEVVFFNHFRRFTYGTLSRCDILYAWVSHPSKIASRFGLRALRRLAFEIREDSSITLHNAISRAKQRVGSLAPESTPESAILRRDAFKKFEKEYDTTFSGFEAITTAGMAFATDVLHGSFLDPRVSELVSRNPYPSSIFLPFLTDDVSRSSAWDVSRELRYFTYSCLLFKNSDTLLERVSEYGRRGARIVEDDVSLLSLEESIQYATILGMKIEGFKSFLADFSKQTIWRPYALYQVFGWYVDSGKELPSKDTLIAVLSGTTNDEQLSWNEVHISAQLQGYLYSLRMLHQILSHLVFDAQEKIKTGMTVRKGTLLENHGGYSSSLTYSYEQAKQLPAELLKLHEILSTLPLLGELIPSRLELATARAMPAAEFEYLFDTLFTSIHEDSEGEEGNITSKGDGKATDTTVSEDLDGMPPEQMEPRKETHVIGTNKSNDGNDGQKGQDKNNRFSVLGSE